MGKSSDINVFIKSYVPYSLFVRQAVTMGRVTIEISLGKNLPNPKMNVFLINIILVK